MNKLLLFISILFFAYPAKSQNYLTTLHLRQGNKIKHLNLEGENLLDIMIDTSPYATKLIQKQYNQVKVINLGKDYITIAPKRIKYTYAYSITDSVYNEEKWTQSHFPPVNIYLSDITGLTFQSNNAVLWQSFGSFLIFAGSVTTLLVAPLLSLDYNKGESFKQDTYYKTTAIGLGLVAVGIPLAVIFKKKYYGLKDIPGVKKTKKHYWKITP